MPTTGSVDAQRRRDALAALIEQRGAVSLADASAAVGVSEMTIRRDLIELEADGRVRRIRGGATVPAGPRRFSVRSNARSEQKQLIARKALSLVPAAGAIALDASTTVGALGGLLTDHADLTVMTNSWQNFTTVGRAGSARVLLTGGEAEPATDSLIGPIATRAAGSLSYDVVFVSASGVDAELGSCDVSLGETQVKQEFARSSQRVVLLADSSKLGGRDIARSFTWEQIDVLVTDLDPDDAALRPLIGLAQII